MHLAGASCISHHITKKKGRAGPDEGEKQKKRRKKIDMQGMDFGEDNEWGTSSGGSIFSLPIGDEGPKKERKKESVEEN